MSVIDRISRGHIHVVFEAQPCLSKFTHFYSTKFCSKYVFTFPILCVKY